MIDIFCDDYGRTTDLINSLSENTTPKNSLAVQHVKFMREQWAPPQLIISVTGGVKLFKLVHLQIHTALEKGLVLAAVTTDEYFLYLCDVR